MRTNKQQKEIETIKIAVQPTFKKKVQLEANRLGVNMSTYIKRVLLNELERAREKYFEELEVEYQRFLEQDKTKPRKRYTDVDELIKDLESDD